MRQKPRTICPRCGILKRGSCAKCGRANERRRGTRQQRGYDDTWLKLRAAKVEANPLCEECERQGYVKVTDEVHHIIAFKGLGDSLRLDWDNLESLCRECHVVKTRARRG